MTTTFLALLKPGDHILYLDDCYRNSRRFFSEILGKFGITATGIPVEGFSDLKPHLRPSSRVIFVECPTNPFLRVIDLRRLSESAREHGILTIVDSTLASPVNLLPIECGADLVIHSATKYHAGHNDLLAGVVAGSSGLVSEVARYRDVLGPTLDPHASYLLLRSLHTLCLRMEEHNRTGLQIAQFLEAHPQVRRVWYPLLDSHPDGVIARSQMDGGAGLITFLIDGSEEETSRFVDNLRIPYIASSLGGAQSLVEQYAVLSFFKDRSEAERRGITGNLIRLSVGLESDSITAQPRLVAHPTLVHDVAVQLLDRIKSRYPSLTVNSQEVLFGAATHDIGKAELPEELSGPGSKHETHGAKILAKFGVSATMARFTQTHANWKSEDIKIEDLLVSLADKIFIYGRNARDLVIVTSTRFVMSRF